MNKCCSHGGCAATAEYACFNCLELLCLKHAIYAGHGYNLCETCSRLNDERHLAERLAELLESLP